MAEVTKVGLDVFSSIEKFKLWLNTPSYALGKLKPIELLKDSYGKEMVISELNRINHGILAQIKVFSLSREKHATPLSGKGAAKQGARWNPVGIALIYTAQNRSLAIAEVAVHLTLVTLPEDYMMITNDITEDIKVKQLTEADLPEDWQALSHPYPYVQVNTL